MKGIGPHAPGYAALIVGLLAFLLSSYLSPPADEPSPGAHPDSVAAGPAAPARVPGGTVIVPPLPPIPPHDLDRSEMVSPDDTLLAIPVARKRRGAGDAYRFKKELDRFVMHITPNGPIAAPRFDNTKRYRDTLAPYPKSGREADGTPYVIVVNAWATGCGPCKKDLPMLKQFFDKSHGDLWRKRVRFAAVHSMSNGYQGFSREMHATTVAQEWASKFPADTLHRYDADEDATLLTALQKANVTADMQIPITFVVDCHGRVRWKHEGELKAGVLEDKLKPAVQKLLEELSRPGGCPVAGDGQCSAPTEGCEQRFAGDCKSACHNDGRCQAWAGESYKNPVYFAQDGCRHPMPECRAEYHPVKHRYCEDDKICSKADGEPSGSIDCRMWAAAEKKKAAAKRDKKARDAAARARKKKGKFGR